VVDYLAFNRRQDFPVLPLAVGGDSGVAFMKFPTAIMIHPAVATILLLPYWRGTLPATSPLGHHSRRKSTS
jgi:hypothetical protein